MRARSTPHARRAAPAHRRADLRLLPTAFAAMLLLQGAQVAAQPAPTQLPVVRPGGASINARVGTPTTGANPSLAVTQTQSANNRALVEWQSFSIGRAATVNIAQPNAQSVLINRVTGDASGRSASEIYGSLNANGRVFLVNPAGVIFGPGAQVNVGSLVATSLDLNDAMTADNYRAALEGGAVGLRLDGSGSSVQVSEQALIRTDAGGSVVLVGSQGVQQHGVIEALQGRVALAAASAAEVLPLGSSGFVNLVVTQAADGGRVATGAASATRAEGGAVNVQAQHIDINGELNVSSATGNGGRIDIGDSTTRSVLLRRDATLSADAHTLGDGGDVTLLAMFSQPGNVARTDFGVTEVYGTINARGGVNGGNGGRVETSGVVVNTRLASSSGALIERGRVNASARVQGGVNGTWTLDPYDVTISNTTTVAIDGTSTFNPTGTRANINAADLEAALNAGTNVVVATGTPETGTDPGNITVASGTTISRTAGTGITTLTLQAHNDIYIDSGSTIQGSTTSPLNINIHSDSDGLGSGCVVVTGSLLTGGGNIDIGGGTTPTTGFARSNGQIDGVHISAATLDTTGASGRRGNIAIRGEAPAGSFSRGISIENSTLTANNIDLTGRASLSAGVALGNSFGTTTLDTDGGTITVRGVAEGTVATGGDPIGVDMSGLDIALGSSGSLLIAGRAFNQTSSSFGNASGVRYRNTRIVAAPTSTGTITLAGELAGNAGLGGLAFYNNESGSLTINGGLDASQSLQATSANVVLGGANASGDALDLGSGFGTDIRTTGMVNIRPLGVDVSGNITEQAATSIGIGTRSSGTFYINPAWIRRSGPLNQGISADGGVVIGSSLHTGRIYVGSAALTQHGDMALTLQNQGAGSQGIDIEDGNTLHDLGLLTAGNVNQIAGSTRGGLTVTRNLVIEGGAQSNIQLTRADNAFGTLAFDPPRVLAVQVTGPLTIGPASINGYTPGTGFTPLNITNSIGGDSALLRATGPITITRSISMAGTNAQLNIVAPTISLGEGGIVSAPAGGSSKLWSDNITGTTTPVTNLYGCVYGDAATCSLSNITIPTTGNFQLRSTRPTLAVTANGSGTAGALPALAPTVTGGLTNGDGATAVVSGTPGSAATASSPAGSYATTQGSVTSPTGYVVSFTPGVLTLAAAPVTPLPLRRSTLETQSGFLAELRTDVYGRNLASPFICTAASLIKEGLTVESKADPLAAEWGKVRNQPQLSGCLDVTSGGQCAAF